MPKEPPHQETLLHPVNPWPGPVHQLREHIPTIITPPFENKPKKEKRIGGHKEREENIPPAKWGGFGILEP
jgi:hypothetical protein